MGQRWVDNNDPSPARRRRRRSPKFGAYTEMTTVIGLIHGRPATAAVEALAEHYPWLPTEDVVGFVTRVRGYAARGDSTTAERMVHNFILKAQRSKPEPAGVAEDRFWRRGDFYWRIAAAVMMAAVVALAVGSILGRR